MTRYNDSPSQSSIFSDNWEKLPNPRLKSPHLRIPSDAMTPIGTRLDLPHSHPNATFTSTHALIVGLIDHLARLGPDACWASNNYIAEHVGKSEIRVRQVIRDLIALGLVYRVDERWVQTGSGDRVYRRILETKWTKAGLPRSEFSRHFGLDDSSIFGQPDNRESPTADTVSFPAPDLTAFDQAQESVVLSHCVLQCSGQSQDELVDQLIESTYEPDPSNQDAPGQSSDDHGSSEMVTITRSSPARDDTFTQDNPRTGPMEELVGRQPTPHDKSPKYDQRVRDLAARMKTDITELFGYLKQRAEAVWEAKLVTLENQSRKAGVSWEEIVNAWHWYVRNYKRLFGTRNELPTIRNAGHFYQRFDDWILPTMKRLGAEQPLEITADARQIASRTAHKGWSPECKAQLPEMVQRSLSNVASFRARVHATRFPERLLPEVSIVLRVLGDPHRFVEEEWLRAIWEWKGAEVTNLPGLAFTEQHGLFTGIVAPHLRKATGYGHGNLEEILTLVRLGGDAGGVTVEEYRKRKQTAPATVVRVDKPVESVPIAPPPPPKPKNVWQDEVVRKDEWEDDEWR